MRNKGIKAEPEANSGSDSSPAEQHRIVTKVDEFMALCDRLEVILTATAATRRCLLEALLAEALAPGEERELEAAE